jgi:hypothetical protein
MSGYLKTALRLSLARSKKGLNLNDVVKVALSYIVKHEELIGGDDIL